MLKNLSFYDDVAALERYIGVPKGALKNIPIYARVGAVDAIVAVREMEKNSLFRPGLYYIVLADLKGNTEFNAKYGDTQGDIRIQWFQTCAIEALGKIKPSNYSAYLKAIGDAALLIFSSFEDVVKWSDQFTILLKSMSDEYAEVCEADDPNIDVDQQIADFELRARRFAHLGEVRFKEASDPICLSVSQTFKIEKLFDREELGCTDAVLSAVRPLLPALELIELFNKDVTLAGQAQISKTHYLVRK
ncbi:hypothetical protein [Rhizobium mulingense]|uniref:hypothetical protein n=1 Tax=Rhizobium mulingense TaxID=3031128 RepID=UPI002B4932C5|nr:hypothetical protein [Rhizobium sp. MJ21]MEB3047695.1 hypothetical protein [Rhizobium sp. MJ21]